MSRTPLAAAGLLVVAGLAASSGVAAADCEADISKAFTAMYAAKPFRTEMLAKGSTDAVRTVNEYGQDGNARITTDSAGEKTQIVIVGDRVWRDDGEGHIEVPPEAAKTLASRFRANQGKSIGQITNPRCNETEVRNGHTYRAFEYDQSFKIAGNDGMSSAKLLVDPATGRPGFMQVTSTAMGVISLSMMTISYDPAIAIEEPIAKAPAKASGAESAPEKK